MWLTAFTLCFQIQLAPLQGGTGAAAADRQRRGDRLNGVGRVAARVPVGRAGHARAHGRGLHSLTSELNLRTFWNTSLPVELNLSTFGTRPRVNLGNVGDKVS
jgi:hypothetical protein